MRDHHDDRDFEAELFQLVRAIPKGRVTSYGALAAALGSAQASRRVGWVLNQSFGVIPSVPAHRVVNRLGQLTGASHFPEDRAMDRLLEEEGVVVSNGSVVDFDRVFWDPMRDL
ncbi:MAG: MGMT family protein [Bacteroidetes bacterium]|nr:MGMT family protein [Bacteroidota bacterium]MDA0903908.1 MGMT family protein [Bacteroidota bacterium]MDA1242754.1 MGMT family protein [Bacteroidota bacterium]